MATYNESFLKEWRLAGVVDDVLDELLRATGNDDEPTDHEVEVIRGLVQRRYDALKARDAE